MVAKDAKKYDRTDIAELWEDKEGIAHIEFKGNRDLKLPQVVDYMNKTIKLAEGEKKPVLVDLRKVDFATDGAVGKMISTDAEKITKAAAVLINIPTKRMRFLISFVLLTKKTSFPVKAFNDEKKAMEWLKTFLVKE